MRAGKEKKNFMGLVLTGHSLGAQVLFKSVAPTLERSLIQSTKPFAGTGIVDETKKMFADGKDPVSGIGDIVLLLNPAFEAYQFERFHRLYRSRRYDGRQQPIMFVVSSENDYANAVAFPLSRFFSLPFRPMFRSEEQGELFSSALGKYAPQQTHRLEPLPVGAKPNLCPVGDADCLDAEDLSGTVRTKSAQLRPLDKEALTYSPVIVANTSKEIVNGHNQIFLPQFVSFVSDYVSEIEFKKIALFREGKRLQLKQALKKAAGQ